MKPASRAPWTGICPRWKDRSGIDISYEKSGVPFALDGTAAIHVYSVLQEALNNVARHSGAHQAQVRLHFSARRAGA